MALRPFHRTEQWRSFWPWLPLWTLAALLAIFSHGPMPLYSTRTLAVAWEMWTHGHWLVPHINGTPYSEKAPLLFWLIHAGWAVFGVSDVWPRLLEVAFGTIELVLLAQLTRRLFPERPWVARAAPWMLLALGYAFLFGLQIMYDVLLAVWVLAALLCLTPRVGRRSAAPMVRATEQADLRGGFAEPRWWLFGVCVGLGLLTKGPVLLLHVVFPWLLGPLWSDVAARDRGRWYGRGALAIALGVAILLAWAVPAGFAGGEAYRHRLFFVQTAGRMVDGVAAAQNLQNHAQPFWWYLLWLPVLLFPFSGWPRAWVALGALRRPLEPGLRFALCWVLPVFVAFSLISGKQAYYPLPEFAGAMLLLAGAVATLRERHPVLGATAWLGTWPLAVGGLAFAVFLFVLPNLVAAHRLQGEWFPAAAAYSRIFSVVFLLISLWLLLRGRGEMRRLAVAGLVGILALNSLFTLTLWPHYDLAPTSQALGDAERAGHAIAITGGYEGQFHFAGRLQQPITELHGAEAVKAFARAHPDGVILTEPSTLGPSELRYAVQAQPFRSSWLVLWPAATLGDLYAGLPPPEPAQPIRLYPSAAERYRGGP